MRKSKLRGNNCAQAQERLRGNKKERNQGATEQLVGQHGEFIIRGNILGVNQDNVRE